MSQVPGVCRYSIASRCSWVWLRRGCGRQGMFDTILSDSRLKALLESVSAEADACCGV
jgi:hypothetical protein